VNGDEDSQHRRAASRRKHRKRNGADKREKKIKFDETAAFGPRLAFLLRHPLDLRPLGQSRIRNLSVLVQHLVPRPVAKVLQHLQWNAEALVRVLGRR